MFASANALVFGPMEEPGVEAGLPQSWLLPTSAADLGSCAMVVNTRGPLDTASWFEVWAGAGAVAAMCVRRGLVGISTGQGEFLVALVERFGLIARGMAYEVFCRCSGQYFCDCEIDFMILEGILATETA